MQFSQRCLSRAGTAADAKIVAVTVAARFFAVAAVQRRGQSASDSPRCCGQRGGFNSRGDWRQRCLSRAGTAADAKSVAVTVAARFFADAAVQQRGQSASDSPRCCGQRSGFNSRGTGAKGACPGLGPRRMQRSSLSRSPRGLLLTLRSNVGDRPAGPAPHFRSRWQMHAGTGTAGACPELGPRRMQRSLLSRSPRGFLLSLRSNDGDSQRVTVPDAAGSAGASTAGGTGAKGACPELGPRRMQRSLLSRSPRGLLLTLRSNDGDSQRVTVPDAAGSAAASTAGGTGAKGACPGLGPRRMQRSSLSRSPRGLLLTPRSNDGDRPAGPAPPLPKSLADVCRDWHRRCLSRVGTAADAKIVAVTVATRAFADAAVQRRGQSASDSPRCCGQRGGFDSRGTGAKCACPGLGPRRMQRASLSPSPRGFLLTPRSNDGDSQQVTAPQSLRSTGSSRKRRSRCDV